MLLLGILLGLGGAVLGIYAFADVLTPIPLEEDHVKHFPMGRIPGHHVENYDALATEIRDLGDAEGSRLEDIAQAKANKASAECAAAAAEAVAKSDEEASAKNKDNKNLKEAAVKARESFEALRLEAGHKAGQLAALEAGQEFWLAQLLARERVRSTVYLLVAADEVAKRYKKARETLIPAALLVALGVWFLALAPVAPKKAANAEGEPTASIPTASLVTVTLTDAGMDALDCSADELQAFRFSESDQEPVIVTIPTRDCPLRIVPFPVFSDSGPLGSLSEMVA
jgi:hypothetical protein